MYTWEMRVVLRQERHSKDMRFRFAVAIKPQISQTCTRYASELLYNRSYFLILFFDFFGSQSSTFIVMKEKKEKEGKEYL